MSGITGFIIAVGIASAFFFIWMIRSDRLRDRRGAYADSSTADSASISSGNEGSGLLNLFSGNSSSSSSSSEDSCTSSSSSFFSSDSSCSSDGGGGGGGGDGGGGGGGGD